MLDRGHTSRLTPVARLLRPAIVTAAMLVGWVFATGSAAADCGDYIVILNPSPAARAHQQAMARQHPTHNPLAPKPCDGPQCRAKPPVSLPATPPTAPNTGPDVQAVLPGEVALHSSTLWSLGFDRALHFTSVCLPTDEPPPRG